MSHTDRLKRSAETFRRLTGITPEVFDRVLARLQPRYAAAAEATRKNRPGRERKPGGGRKPALPRADRLLMLLMYYRAYTTHVFLGFLFGLDDSAVGRNINPLQPLLAGLFRIPERRVELDEEDVRERFFDATERAIPRPARGAAGVLLGEEEAAHGQAPDGGGPAAGRGVEASAGADRRGLPGVRGEDA